MIKVFVDEAQLLINAIRESCCLALLTVKLLCLHILRVHFRRGIRLSPATDRNLSTGCESWRCLGTEVFVLS